MSEASIATSVPVPIAIPRSACASAGASLTPSPTIATMRPSACRRVTTSRLAGGQHLGDDVVDADARRDGVGRRRVVAGQQDRAQPELAQLLHRLARARLDPVGDDEQRLRRAVPAGGDRGAPLGLGRRARALELGRQRERRVGAGQQRGAPGDDRAPGDRALHAEAGAAGEVLDLGRRGLQPPRGRRDRAPDRVLGAVLQRADEPQRLRLADASATLTLSSVMRPVVAVPVLSMRIVSTRRVASST